MPKIILLCGRICSGKSTYAEKLRRELPAAVLSVDGIMLSLFGQDAGEKHDEYCERLKKYIFDKSVELHETGINAVLDIGLWTAEERKAARDFYSARGIKCEIHYIDISDEEWARRVKKRNEAVSAGEVFAYCIDEGLAAKAAAVFEEPDDSGIDIRITGAEQ